MTFCGCVPILDSLHQSPAAWGLGAEKRAQLVLDPVKRLQRRGND